MSLSIHAPHVCLVMSRGDLESFHHLLVVLSALAAWIFLKISLNSLSIYMIDNPFTLRKNFEHFIAYKAIGLKLVNRKKTADYSVNDDNW